MLACKHVLDAEELATLNESLVSVLLTLDYRIQNVEGMTCTPYMGSLTYQCR